MASKPKIPTYVPPAAKPERQVDVEVEDVQLGDDQSQDTTAMKRGKRSLMRPTGAGTGLAV
ncbi:virion assembly protein [Aeromonas phage vB_AspA_Tola]|nr:virion assembly protein [Aeromonas phage vB_AspA_Tola]